MQHAIDPLAMTLECRSLLALAINSFGSDDHPVCSHSNLSKFSVHYAKQCMVEAVNVIEPDNVLYEQAIHILNLLELQICPTQKQSA